LKLSLTKKKNGTGDQWGAVGDSGGTGFDESLRKANATTSHTTHPARRRARFLYERSDDRFEILFYVPGSSHLKGTKVMIAVISLPPAGIRRAGRKNIKTIM